MKEIVEALINETLKKEVQLNKLSEITINEIFIANQVDAIKNMTLHELKEMNEMRIAEFVLNHIVEGKENYYPKIYEDMEKEGYIVYGEDKLKKIKLDDVTNSTGKDVDGVYIKDNEVIISEIKSPKECQDIKGTKDIDVHDDEEKSNWGGKLKEYNDELNKNTQLSEREKAHLVHIKKTELITEQLKKEGTIQLKDGSQIELKDKEVKIGYTVPEGEAKVVQSALDKAGIKYELKQTTNGSTFIIKA